MASRRLSLAVSWALEVGSRAGSRLCPCMLPFEPEAIRAPQKWLVATPSFSRCVNIVDAAELSYFLDFWLDGSCPPCPPLESCSRIRGGVSRLYWRCAVALVTGGGEVFLGGEGLRR